MHEINDAIVQDGKLVLSHLPFADGQRVKVTVSELGKLPIGQVRELLKGGVERSDAPFEPMIPDSSWEMLK